MHNRLNCTLTLLFVRCCEAFLIYNEMNSNKLRGPVKISSAHRLGSWFVDLLDFGPTIHYLFPQTIPYNERSDLCI